MRTLVSTSEELRTEAKSYNVINNGTVVDVYQYSEHAFASHNYNIEISCPIIDENNFHLLVHNRNLKIIVSEKKQINRPQYTHNYKKQMLDKDSYECLRTFTIDLPNNDLYIAESYFEKERHMVKIILKHHLN